ncbi:MAG: tryptophan synthase alpha chain [Kiritimatiellia bacterium]|jgi:tryptophan synthase alpha chain
MKPTRIDERFAQLKKDGKKGFVAYLTAGDPNLPASLDIVKRLEDAGADFIEFGVPFSDPLADGPTIQAASQRALEGGATLKGVYETLGEIRSQSEIPLVLFTYMNPMYAQGFERAVKRAAKAGVDGMLIVDISMEEVEPYAALMEKHGLNHIPLVTPTTPGKRMKEIVKTASGFVYAVSRTGVTGVQNEMQKDATELLRKANRYSKLPVALGFGVSTPEQARAYAELTDAVVVGSYIVKCYHEAGDSPAGRKKATAKIKKLIDAVKSV